MKDFKEFLSNNENRNLWFSAMACGMALAIVVFALACSAVMVFGEVYEEHGTPAFKDSSNGESLCFTGSLSDIRLVENSSGLYDAVSEYGFVFTGVINSNGTFNGAGSRIAQSSTFTFNGVNKTYYIITDLVWADRVSDNEIMYEFDFSNRDNGLKSIFDSSFNQYSSNFNDVLSVDNDLNNLFNVSLKNANQYTCTLEISPSAELSNYYSDAQFSCNYKVYSYALYTSHTVGTRTFPKDFLDKLAPDGIMKTDNYTYTGTNSAGVAQVGNVCIKASSYNTSTDYYGYSTVLSAQQSCYAVVSNPSTNNISFGAGGVSQTLNFDDSVYIDGGKIMSPKFPAGFVSQKANQDFLGYFVECNIVFRDNNGNFKSSPLYAYILNSDIKWLGTSSSSPTNSSTVTSTDDNGNVSVTSVSSYNDIGTIGDLDNQNIIEFIKNGMGLGGSNGLIMLIQETFKFVPTQIWALIFAGLALSIVLMVVKILRGM